MFKLNSVKNMKGLSFYPTCKLVCQFQGCWHKKKILWVRDKVHFIMFSNNRRQRIITSLFKFLEAQVPWSHVMQVN